MTELEPTSEQIGPRPRTAIETFIASHVGPRLAPDERILHTGYLVGEMQASGSIGAMIAVVTLRACFIALTQTRAFFLWNVPGRIGVFAPLCECGRVQIAERSQITANVRRSGLFARALWLNVSGEIMSFRLKRTVKSLPDQAHLIDALCAPPWRS